MNLEMDEAHGLNVSRPLSGCFILIGLPDLPLIVELSIQGSLNLSPFSPERGMITFFSDLDFYEAI